MKNAPDKRLVVITGATRGLGRAMADEFIRRGHVVAGCGRSSAACRKWTAQYGPPHSFCVVDVASDEMVHAWAASVLLEHGVPDLLVNNAAMMNRPAPLWQITAEEFSAVVDVNIKGVVNVLRHFVPAMVANGNGVVVNISSGWGRSTSPNVASYCATKWAVEGLTRSLSQELPAGLAAVAVNPGVINTDMLRSCFGADAEQYPAPEAWARIAVPFLLGLGPQDNGKSLAVPD